MQQRYRCPNCQVPVNYGQPYCNSCSLPINWQGVSPSAPFNAKDVSSGPGAPAPGLQPVPGSEGSEQWKHNLQEKSRLWHKKLAYDPNYGQSHHKYVSGRTRPRAALIVLLVLVIALVAFVGLGLATHGTYFGLFSKQNPVVNSPVPSPAISPTPTVAADNPGTPPNPTPPPLPIVAPQLNRPQVSADSENSGQPDAVGVLGQKPAFNAAELEQQVHSLINQQRVANGLTPLSWDAKLNAVARGHSSDMAARNYFNHVTPEGLNVSDRYRQAGYMMTAGCGENIFMCPQAKADYYQNGVLVGSSYYQQSEMADVIVQGWMNSSGHRQNILSNNWKVQSIGIAISADDKVYITEDFA